MACAAGSSSIVCSAWRLPRVRDFKGVSERAFDGRGNYTLGIREQIIFPEVDYDKVDRVTGMNITVVTTANTDAEGRALLTHTWVCRFPDGRLNEAREAEMMTDPISGHADAHPQCRKAKHAETGLARLRS